MTFNMYPDQHDDEENRFQQGGSENNFLSNAEKVFNDGLYKELQAFIKGTHNEEQPSGARHPRPLQDHNDREQPSGDRDSRPLRDPDGEEQRSGDESEAGSDPLAGNGENKLASVRGKTKGKNETLMYLHNGKWVPAVYHDTVRHYLIEKAKKNGEYDFPREAGIEPDNVTSFLESQKSWGPVRDENWAPILYAFEKKDKNPPKDNPVNWKVGRRVVLAGRDSKPILDYKDIPATLSTELAGRDMEAIKRTDPRIRQRDFIARMPIKYTTKTGKRRKAKSASWIGMEMTRFRQKHGMLSWVGREGSDVIRNALWKRLPKKNREKNTIRGLPPPTALEQEEVREGNLGKFTKNAGVRALPNEERAKRQQRKEQRRLQKLIDPMTGVSSSKTTAPTSGLDGMAGRDGGRRGQQARNSRTQQDRSANERGRRPSPDFQDNMTRPDGDQEDDEPDDESDMAPPKDGTRQRIEPRMRHRPRGRPQKTRERPSASDDGRMQPPENDAWDVFPFPSPPPPPPSASATVDQYDSDFPSPPDYEAYLKRQGLQRKTTQQIYKY